MARERKKAVPKKRARMSLSAATRRDLDLCDLKSFHSLMDKAIRPPAMADLGFLLLLREAAVVSNLKSVFGCQFELRRRLDAARADLGRFRFQRRRWLRARVGKLFREHEKLGAPESRFHNSADGLASFLTFKSPPPEAEIDAERRIAAIEQIDCWLDEALGKIRANARPSEIRASLQRAVELGDKIDPQSASSRVIDTQSEVAHSEDFTTVRWYGTQYTFRPGQQTRIVELLWKEWERKTRGLSRAKLAELLESNAQDFRVSHVFIDKRSRKKHPAWNTLIREVESGIYALVKPTPEEPR